MPSRQLRLFGNGQNFVCNFKTLQGMPSRQLRLEVIQEDFPKRIRKLYKECRAGN